MSAAPRRCWLLKTEPSVYSIDDLQREGAGAWDGVRNYQARNLLRDEMRDGDPVFIYHSSCGVPGIAGLAKIIGPAEPDPTQWNPRSKYFDAASPAHEPRWWLRRVAFVAKFSNVVALSRLRGEPQLAGMPLLRRFQRLSVQPVTETQYRCILALAPSAPAARRPR